ncbi:carbohydrate kinase family protein [Aegicerativicinus sediminis]|uniref:carbohydrate kinase family protein n=1 Tax=Aegicerativicinus sediminis TaxID=2893202 RepID=UPI001E3C2EC4|nr:carbohydrate kinase [Aegicerativicinus sediminis]
MNRGFDLVCYGEVLWDVFPDKSVIGGAPLNVALRANSFGLTTAMISRVGSDDFGRGILNFMEERQLSTKFIQIDTKLPTGTVKVWLDKNGTASYKIMFPVAWDAIEFTNENKQLVGDSKVLVFGSLICRNEKSRDTLNSLLPYANYKVFDVNLRPPDYELPLLVELMKSSDLVKMNSEELDEISKFLNIDESDEQSVLLSLSRITSTPSICITKGEKGAILFHGNQFYEQAGFKVKVADTVGAGDSFLATLISELIIFQNSSKNSLEKACAIGSLVASKSGATPQLTLQEIALLINN